MGFIYRKVRYSAMAKGEKTGGGSRKGIQNKATKEIKDMINGALNAVGGEKYLIRQAEENPVAFMTLIGKIIPKDVNANLTGNVQLILNKNDANI